MDGVHTEEFSEITGSLTLGELYHMYLLSPHGSSDIDNEDLVLYPDTSVAQRVQTDPEWRKIMNKGLRNIGTGKILSAYKSAVTEPHNLDAAVHVLLGFAQSIEDNIYKGARSQVHYDQEIDQHIHRIAKEGLPPSLEDDIERSKDKVLSEEINTPSSMLDISAHCVGQNFTCEQIQQHQPPLDNHLLKKIAVHAFPESEQDIRCLAAFECDVNELDMAESLLQENDHVEMQQVGFMVNAYIPKEDSNVLFTFEKGKIISSQCSQCSEKRNWCMHIIAAVLHRIRHATEIEVFAPMMESLSCLSKVQIQKLLHYAVQDEPALLPKIFKRYKEVCDATSDINMADGAPDRTSIGAAQMNGQDTFSSVLTGLCERMTLVLTDGDLEYPKDYKEKPNATVGHYLNHLKKLGKCCLFDEAMELQTKFLDIIASVDCLETRVPFGTFCRDLELFICALLVHPTLPDQQRVSLGKMIKQQASFASEIGLNLAKEGICWNASLPFCVSMSPDEDVPFLLEASEMAQAGRWPDELIRVMELPWQDTCTFVYSKEHFTVSMHRFEALIYFQKTEYSTSNGVQPELIHLKIARLGFWLLVQQFRSSKMGFILTHYTSNCIQPSLQKITDLLNEPTFATLVEPPQKKQKLNTNESKSRELSQIPMSQQVFLALHISVEIIEAMKSDAIVKKEFESVMLWFCFFTLELSRYWTIEKKVTESEMNHLVELQDIIVEYLKEAQDLAVQIQMYFQALKSCGLAHYDHCLPIGLVDTLLVLYDRLPSYKKCVPPLMVIQVCDIFLTDSDAPTVHYVGSSLAKTAILSSSYYERGNGNKLLLHKFYNIASKMLKLFDTTNQEHIKAIEHAMQSLWCGCIDVILLHMVVLSCEKERQKISEKGKPLKIVVELVYNVLLSCLEQAKADKIDKVNISGSFVIQLLKEVEFHQKKVKDFVPLWHLVLDEGDLTCLLNKLMNTIEEPEAPEEKSVEEHISYYINILEVRDGVEKMALDSLKRMDRHILGSKVNADKGNLSMYFLNKSPEYKEAREIVLGEPDKFGYTALLTWVSKELLEHTSSISANVFLLLSHALAQIRTSFIVDTVTCSSCSFNITKLDQETKKQLQCIFEKCLEYDDMDKDLTQLVRIITENDQDPPDIIRILLDIFLKDNISPTFESLHSKVDLLNEKLLRNYVEYYDRILRRQTRYCYKYKQFVGSLKVACDEYVEHAKGGEEKFTLKVVSVLKQRHSAKRKLCVMLNEAFTEHMNTSR